MRSRAAEVKESSAIGVNQLLTVSRDRLQHLLFAEVHLDGDMADTEIVGH